MWAVEDCRHVAGRLERGLLASGEQVVRVAPGLTETSRRAVREPGKSDPIDATAIARAGPIIGGLLVQEVSWQSVFLFLLNVPTAVVAIAGALWLTVESRAQERSATVDIPGFVLAICGSCSSSR